MHPLLPTSCCRSVKRAEKKWGCLWETLQKSMAREAHPFVDEGILYFALFEEEAVGFQLFLYEIVQQEREREWSEVQYEKLNLLGMHSYPRSGAQHPAAAGEPFTWVRDEPWTNPMLWECGEEQRAPQCTRASTPQMATNWHISHTHATGGRC